MASCNFSESIFLIHEVIAKKWLSSGTVFVNLLRYPLGSFAHFMVDSRLLFHGTAESSRGYANEGPPAIEVDDQGPSTITKTSVLLAFFVSSTKHFIVELNSDGFVAMPTSTLVIVNDWHEDLVQDVGPRFAERVVSLAPSGDDSDFAHQIGVGGG